MRILVAGGAGFIGSHICKNFARQGHDVYCMDNFDTGSLVNIRNENVKMVNYDIKYEPPITVDLIYNAASPTAPSVVRQTPINTLLTSVLGTLSLLRVAQKSNAQMIQLSSVRTLEHTPTNHPLASYIEGKRSAEALCYEFKKQGVDVKIARLFSVYGPNMSPKDSRVIPQFIIKALKGENIEIYGNGEQVDYFCYIDDIISAFSVMSHSENVALNIGSRKGTTINELATLIIELTGSKSNVIHVDFDSKIQQNRTNIEPDLVGWEPKVSLRKGLENTIEYFKSVII